jgi:Domain of unknown function (DUF1854).
MAEEKKTETVADKEKTAADKEKPAAKPEVKKDEKEEKDSGAKTESSDKPAEVKPDKEKKDILDEIDDGDLILEEQRESVPLTSKNATFKSSLGGLISMTLMHDGAEDEFFERVVVLRSFPISNPDEFISVREPDSKQKGKGKEIGMIRRLSEFGEATARLINDELNRRYFSPIIQRIYSVKEKFGYSYWESDTTAGRVTFILNNPFSNIRVLEDGRIFINDIDGNSFEIPDPKKLDTASYRKIEIYL